MNIRYVCSALLVQRQDFMSWPV